MTDGVSIQAGMYARVSSDQQSKDQTIASQVEILRQRMSADGVSCPAETQFVDDGYSGSTLVRPSLERLRDVAAAGGLDRLYVHSPDRLARKYIHQVVLLDEFQRCGVEVMFLNHEVDSSPEGTMLLQMQGMVAEYERAKIMERSRRGRLHAARRGSVNVLAAAPFGYRYLCKHDGGGEARYQVDFEQARAVQQMFAWVGRDRLSLTEVCRRLTREGIPSPRGRSHWERTSVWHILRNPAYKGLAAFGKSRVGPLRPRLRPRVGQPEQPRRAVSVYEQPAENWIRIPVPALVDEDLFEAVAEQLAENRRCYRQRKEGARYLLQGLVQCQKCGHAYCGYRLRRREGGEWRIIGGYYRCNGKDAHRFGGEPICDSVQVHLDLLEAAVWEDVRSLLSDPRRIEEEYHRRLEGERAVDRSLGRRALSVQVSRVKTGLNRLIDAYGEGLLEHAEFEPRVKQLKARLAKLTEEARSAAAAEEQVQQLRLAMGQFREFAAQVQDRLDQADWGTRRDILRALVKRVEVGPEEVRIVYRIGETRSTDVARTDSSRHCSKLQRG